MEAEISGNIGKMSSNISKLLERAEEQKAVNAEVRTTLKFLEKEKGKS